MKEHLISFLIYSYIGATFEHISYFIGSFIKDSNPKMLANPVITGFPLYGVGAYLMILTNTILKDENILIRFIVNGTVVTILEYIIGLYVGAGSNTLKNGLVQSWNYSEEKCNVDGIISLRHFISWGVLGMILEKVHPTLINKINKGKSASTN